jgi:hypothetical protein
MKIFALFGQTSTQRRQAESQARQRSASLEAKAGSVGPEVEGSKEKISSPLRRSDSFLGAKAW